MTVTDTDKRTLKPKVIKFAHLKTTCHEAVALSVFPHTEMLHPPLPWRHSWQTCMRGSSCRLSFEDSLKSHQVGKHWELG